MVSALNPDSASEAGANGDWTIPQDWDSYSDQDHATWNTLFARQIDLLPGRASDSFLRGLDVLRLSKLGIPDFAELSERLTALTGWQVVAVPGLVPDAVFFEHLANRRFVAGNFIRRPDQLDYLQEPDVFHDVFGHVPMLSDPIFADYMEAYGKGGKRALARGTLDQLARLYWYTVEFGLVAEPEGLRIYGAGIVSSYSETWFALEDDSPDRIAFDPERVMRTKYRIDDFQQTYFVIPSFEELRRTTAETDFGPIYDRITALPDIAVGSRLAEDAIISTGTQSHIRGQGALAS